MTYNPDNRPGDPVYELPEVEPKHLCAFDGNFYLESKMVFEKGTGVWVHKDNLKAFAEKQVSEHEVKEFINLIIKENGKA